eukprot:19367_1
MSGTFGTGLIFYYWLYFDPKTNQNPKVEKQNKTPHWNINDYSGHNSDKLFIPAAKYANLKEEALRSGYCPLVLFQHTVIGKVNEWIRTDKVKQIIAKYDKFDQASHYGIGKGETI